MYWKSDMNSSDGWSSTPNISRSTFSSRASIRLATSSASSKKMPSFV